MHSIRQQTSFVAHEILDWQDINVVLKGVQNFIHVSDRPEERWIVDTTTKIGDWRSLIRTTYMRWYIAIDALEQAARTCADMPSSYSLAVPAIRPGEHGPEEIPLDEWTGSEAARNQHQTAALLPAYGLTDLLGSWEEIQFELYRIFLTHHPQILMKGEHKPLRQIYYARHKNDEAATAWCTSWKERLEDWQRRRIYDGFGRIFLAYMQHAGLKKPSRFHRSTIEDWAACIEGVAELRNLITHGATPVSDKLASLTNKPASMGFDFIEGAHLSVELKHLQLGECFFNQLLTAVNVSLIEKVRGPLDRASPRQSER